MLDPIRIKEAYDRIHSYIHKTPVMQSSWLNEQLGHEIYFKVEPLQKTGAFKIRGALNALLSYQERHGTLPEKVVAFSSGNHAQAVAYAGKILGVQVRIYTPGFSSKAKIQAARSYGAQIVYTKTRKEAEEAVSEAQAEGFILLHPFNHEDVLLGQGTACYEALQQQENIHAIFATCGGGGWLSGTYLAKSLLSPSTAIYAAEPESGDDAYQSYHKGEIVTLSEPCMSIADGVRTSAVGEITFPYLQQLDGFFRVSEERIIYWTQWLNHLLKVRVEPTSAAALAAIEQWLPQQSGSQRILVLLSGGNIDVQTECAIWEHDYLQEEPGKVFSS